MMPLWQKHNVHVPVQQGTMQMGVSILLTFWNWVLTEDIWCILLQQYRINMDIGNSKNYLGTIKHELIPQRYMASTEEKPSISGITATQVPPGCQIVALPSGHPNFPNCAISITAPKLSPTRVQWRISPKRQLRSVLTKEIATSRMWSWHRKKTQLIQKYIVKTKMKTRKKIDSGIEI